MVLTKFSQKIVSGFLEGVPAIPDQYTKAQPRGIRWLASIGGGEMGANILQHDLVTRGEPVQFVEADRGRVESTLAELRRRLMLAAKKLMKDENWVDGLMRRVFGQVGFPHAELFSVDLVIEAVTEIPDVKREALRNASRAAPFAIIVTNTTSMSVTELTEHVEDPGRFAGLHFLKGAPLGRVVEIILWKGVRPEVVGGLYDFARDKLKLIPIFCQDRPFTSLMYVVDMNTAVNLVLHAEDPAAAIAKIERESAEFGRATGPFSVADATKLDVVLHASREFAKALPADLMEVSPLAAAMVNRGWMGRVRGGGVGFFVWDAKGKRVGVGVRPEVVALILEMQGSLGITKLIPTDQISAMTVIQAMARGARWALDTGMVSDRLSVDLALVHGYGWPVKQGTILDV